MFIADHIIINFNVIFAKGVQEEIAFLEEYFMQGSTRCLFPIIEWEKDSLTPIKKKYIEDRLYCKNKKILYVPYEAIQGIEMPYEVYWIIPKNKKEIQLLIEEATYQYDCCIIPEDEEDIQHYKFFLHIEEDFMYEGEAYRTLMIRTEESKEEEKKLL